VKVESRAAFYPLARFPDRRRSRLDQVPAHTKKAKNGLECDRHFPGTMLGAMNWSDACRCKRARIIAKELTMRNRILAVAAIAAAIGVPLTAQAQSEITTGVARGGSVIMDDDGDVDGIAVDQRPAFREYIVREHVPDYTIPDRVVVGGVLPEAGVTYYDVPQTYGVTPYRYTVVNGRTILVDPHSRRIVQVVE
jgi:Protein of unknown function (DUF1236)